jgi:hypothetical protein
MNEPVNQHIIQQSPMHIFSNRPSTWQDLQNFVGKLFSEIGYAVEVSKVISLVRGNKEIDVFVQDTKSEYGTTFLIECKHWSKPVNQETVHAFHTIMNDAGANFGFIVSKNGFQSGSYEAVEKTNINLVTLEELEERFYGKWQVGMAKKLMPLADRLFPYWDTVGGKQPKGGGISWDTHQLLNRANHPFVRLGPGDVQSFREREYPQILPVLDDKFAITDYVTLNNDRDYFDFIENNAEKSLRQYQLLYREIIG